MLFVLYCMVLTHHMFKMSITSLRICLRSLFETEQSYQLTDYGNGNSFQADCKTYAKARRRFQPEPQNLLTYLSNVIHLTLVYTPKRVPPNSWR